MSLHITRKTLLNPLQQVVKIVERKQTMPILGHVLIEACDHELRLSATDTESELRIQLELETPVEEGVRTTLPARKLLDIVRALPDEAMLEFEIGAQQSRLRSGRSRFSLSTLPADDFPLIETPAFDLERELAPEGLSALLSATSFAMAQNDVRYFLNGLLLEFDTDVLRAIATDGFRLAYGEMGCPGDFETPRQIIVPRKGVIGFTQLIDAAAEHVVLRLDSNHVQLECGALCLTSKLIDGRFPDYRRVLPEGGQFTVTASRAMLRTAMTRVAVLCGERHRGVRMVLEPWQLRLLTSNPEHEEAEEELEVNYQGEAIEIGFNVNYLLDALAARDSENVLLMFNGHGSSCLIHGEDDAAYRYVVMPMRL